MGPAQSGHTRRLASTVGAITRTGILRCGGGGKGGVGMAAWLSEMFG
jgi:hypothetical protein